MANHEYDNNDEDEDDDEEGLLAYDDEEYNSDGDSRSKSEADILSDGVEHQQAYRNRLLAGIRSSDRNKILVCLPCLALAFNFLQMSLNIKYLMEV